MADAGVKFIRVNGRVVPIKGEGSAPKGSGVSKRYGAKPEKAKPSKSIGVAKGAYAGATFGAAATGLFLFGKHAKVLGEMVRAKKAGLSMVGKIPSLNAKDFLIDTYVKGAGIGAAIGAAIGSVKIYKKKRG